MMMWRPSVRGVPMLWRLPGPSCNIPPLVLERSSKRQCPLPQRFAFTRITTYILRSYLEFGKYQQFYPTRNRIRIRSLHRWPERCQKGGGHCSAKSLAPPAGPGGTAGRGVAEKYYFDRSDRCWQNRNLATVGKTCQCPFYQGGSLQIHRSRLCWQRCGVHDSGIDRYFDQNGSGSGDKAGRGACSGIGRGTSFGSACSDKTKSTQSRGGSC